MKEVSQAAHGRLPCLDGIWDSPRAQDKKHHASACPHHGDRPNLVADAPWWVGTGGAACGTSIQRESPRPGEHRDTRSMATTPAHTSRGTPTHPKTPPSRPEARMLLHASCTQSPHLLFHSKNHGIGKSRALPKNKYSHCLLPLQQHGCCQLPTGPSTAPGHSWDKPLGDAQLPPPPPCHHLAIRGVSKSQVGQHEGQPPPFTRHPAAEHRCALGNGVGGESRSGGPSPFSSSRGGRGGRVPCPACRGGGG